MRWQDSRKANTCVVARLDQCQTAAKRAEKIGANREYSLGCVKALGDGGRSMANDEVRVVKGKQPGPALVCRKPLHAEDVTLTRICHGFVIDFRRDGFHDFVPAWSADVAIWRRACRPGSAADLLGV